MTIGWLYNVIRIVILFQPLWKPPCSTYLFSYSRLKHTGRTKRLLYMTILYMLGQCCVDLPFLFHPFSIITNAC